MLRATKFSYDKLFALLKEHGKDDWQFAFEIGTDFNTIQRMMSGRMISTATLNRLCDVLGVNLSDIMEHQELDYPNGVTFCDYLKEHIFWDDLEDVCLREIRFRFHECNDIDKMDDLRFIIDNTPQDIDDVMAQIISNVDMNPDTNPYTKWVVTDRALSSVVALKGPSENANSQWGGGGIRGFNMSVAYALTIDVTDPRLLEQEDDENA